GSHYGLWTQRRLLRTAYSRSARTTCGSHAGLWAERGLLQCPAFGLCGRATAAASRGRALFRQALCDALRLRPLLLSKAKRVGPPGEVACSLSVHLVAARMTTDTSNSRAGSHSS